MSEWPLVSIVTPSLNQSRFIRETIDSILLQDYPNIEYWVIDGGSDDGTVNILESYGDQIFWVSETDSGQSQAVNKGWKFSHGEILGWVNADDLLQPLAIRHAVEVLLANPSLSAVYGNTDYISDDGRLIESYPVRAFDYDALVSETENYIPQPSVFMRRDVLEKVGFLNENLHYVMDFDLWLRLGLITTMEYIPKDMAALRLHAAAKTVKAVSEFAHELSFIYRVLLSNPALPLSLRKRQKAIMHVAYIHSASFCFWGGQTKNALRYLQKAWKLQSFPNRRTFWLLLVFSLFGKTGWKLAEFFHGNPMQLSKSWLNR